MSQYRFDRGSRPRPLPLRRVLWLALCGAAMLWPAAQSARASGSFTLDSISLDKSSVNGGDGLNGAVRFQGAAPAGGAVVTLASNHPEIALPSPSTVTLYAGQSEARIGILTYPVATPTSVVLSATYAGVTRSVSLLLTLPALADFSVRPAPFAYHDEIYGRVSPGDSATGIVLLDGVTNAGNVTVTLTHDHPEIVQMPDHVVVSRYANDAGFPIRAVPVLTLTPVQVTASYAGVSRTIVFQIHPPALDRFKLNNSTEGASVSGGVPVGAEVLLTSEPPAGAQIAVSTERPDVIVVPAQVAVPSEQTWVDFTITTKPVTTTTRARVFVAFNGQKLALWLTLLPARISSLTLVLGPDMNQDRPLAVLMLSGPAPPGGVVVGLSGAGTTNSITVPAGASLAATPIWAPEATTSAVYGGVLLQARWELPVYQWNSAPPSPGGATANPQRWVVGGQSLMETLTIPYPAPPGGRPFQLSSSDESVLRVPRTVTIPAGQQSVSYTIDTSPVSTDHFIIIYIDGGISGLWVVPSGLFSVTFDSGRIIGGRSVVGTVTFTDPAPAGGRRVTLLSSDAGIASVPPAVEVPAGATSAMFPITTHAVADALSVAIVAVSEERERVAALRVQPPKLAALAVSPPSVHGGDAAVGTVTLSDPAPAEGLVVQLQTDHLAYCVLPDTVAVPPDSTTATFPVLTDPVATPIVVRINANHGNDYQTTTFTLLP